MTQDQKKLIKKHQYASIKFDPQEEMPAPAYCVKGKTHYEVHLAKEIRDDSTKKKFLSTLLMHELGHLECRHLDVDYDVEFDEIKRVKEEFENTNNIPESDRRVMEFPMILNIAGDLEVNSKYLTLGDIKFMTEQGFTPVTLQNFNTTFKDHYFDYYEDVIRELYKRPAIPVIIMDMEASSKAMGGKGQKGEKTKSETDTVTGVMRSSNDDYDEEMSDDKGDEEEKKSKDGDENSDSSNNKGQGTGNSKVFVARSKKETEEELTRLLLSIKETKRYKKLDPLRLYNRGTRRNEAGILYNSIKRKVRKCTDKLGILIDVSGSMNISSVMKSIESIARLAPELHTDTKVKCWQSSKTDEFLVSNIPERIRSGGGTYLPAGLKEFLDEEYNNIVIYSDFCDTLEDYIKILDERPCKLYLVSTEPDSNLNNGWGGGGNWEELKKRATRIIFTSED